MNQFPKAAMLSLLVAFLASCGGGGASASASSEGSLPSSGSNQEPSTFDGTDYYDSLSDRVAEEGNSELSFDESLEDGKLNDDRWWVIDGYWDAGGASNWHNGVRARNLRYYNDGKDDCLGIKARGSYCQDSDLLKAASGHIKPEGACIMSQDFLNPGRFEISMKTMPREGAVTAMWTYYSSGSEATSQNEIDIELGGNAQYTNEWTTSWTTHTDKETDSVDVTSICHLNDGAFHKYTFDWYTNYQNQDIKRVDWFIDGILIKSITGSCVPEKAMPLWIGLWCPSWAGNPTFDYDYMLIKDIAYTEFDETSQFCEGTRGNPAYTHTLPSASNIATASKKEAEEIEKFSNVGFESLDVCATDTSYFGWLPETASKGTVTLSDEHTEGSHSFKLTSGTSDQGNYHGEYLDQKLTLVYEGYQFAFSIDAKMQSGAAASIEIAYKSASEKSLSKDTIALDSTDWKSYSKAITMPKDAAILSINLVVEDGVAYFDNASLQAA